MFIAYFAQGSYMYSQFEVFSLATVIWLDTMLPY